MNNVLPCKLCVKKDVCKHATEIKNAAVNVSSAVRPIYDSNFSSDAMFMIAFRCRSFVNKNSIQEIGDEELSCIKYDRDLLADARGSDYSGVKALDKAIKIFDKYSFSNEIDIYKL